MPIHAHIEHDIAVLCLDRPSKANAYDRALLVAFDQALDRVLAQGPRALVVESAGDGAFCGGADLAELAVADPIDALDLYSQRVFDRLARAPVVSIAAVHGAAIAGGFELALACDLRVVGPAARFALPETALGLIPSAGGTTRLTTLLGPSIARQVILAGAEIDATTAVRWGLALALDDDPRTRARAIARSVAERDPVALRLAKEIIVGDGGSRQLREERLAEALLYARKRDATR